MIDTQQIAAQAIFDTMQLDQHDVAMMKLAAVVAKLQQQLEVATNEIRHRDKVIADQQAQIAAAEESKDDTG